MRVVGARGALGSWLYNAAYIYCSNPTRVQARERVHVIYVATGGNQCLAVTEEDSVFSWGRNEPAVTGNEIGTMQTRNATPEGPV